MKGLFITFEGVEGCGKTTQLQRLRARLEERSVRVHCTREPGGEPDAEKIRSLLMAEDSKGLVPRADFFLFLASRAQHLDKVVRPLVESGVIVLCDRFEDSTWAYQHYAEGLGPLETLRACNTFATQGMVPDLKILFDLDPLEGLRRKGKDATTRFDQRKLDYHRAVREGYRALAENHRGWLVVRADQSIEMIAGEIFRCVERVLSPQEAR